MQLKPEQIQLIKDIGQILNVLNIAGGGRGSFSGRDSLSFDPTDVAEINRHFKMLNKTLKANNTRLDRDIKNATTSAFDEIVGKITKSLPTRNNILRRMDDVFDDMEDSVNQFDRALGASTKRLLREFNGNLDELSKVKRSFGNVVRDVSKFSKTLEAEKLSSETVSNMANILKQKIDDMESDGLKELADTLKPTLDTLKRVLDNSKDGQVEKAEMDELRQAIVQNLPRMVSADEKMSRLFSQYIASQKEQAADFANTMRGAIALIGNDIRRLPNFITSEATNFQGGGMSPSNWWTAFTQGMSPQDYNQMQLRYMVLQARGQEAFNDSVNEINANLRNDYGLIGEQQTQMRTVLLDIAKNIGGVDNAGFVDQVNVLTKTVEGIAQREGVSMQDAANMMLDISNESYMQSRLIGKTADQQVEALTKELDTRSRLNKQLGINFEMQKQMNREQRSRLFGGFAEKLKSGIMAGMAARTLGATEEEAKIMRASAMGAYANDPEKQAEANALEQKFRGLYNEGLIRETTENGIQLGPAHLVEYMYREGYNENTANLGVAGQLAAQQYRDTTASGDNTAFIGATGSGINDMGNAKPGLDAPSIATMYVSELIYAGGASPLGSVLGGIAGTALELAQTALLLGMGGGLAGKAAGLLRGAGGMASSAASRILASRAGGATGASIAARGGMAAVGTVGAAAVGGLGALYAGYGNTTQMFNPATTDAEGNALTREQITSSQVTGTMKNIAILAGGAIGLIGGPVGVAIGAGAGALVGELGEAVSDYIPDWAKMLTPLGQISMGLEKGINQWKELTDIQGNVNEIDRIEQGIKDGTLQIDKDLINSYADISDHTAGFWGGSTFTSSAEKEAAAQRLNAIFAAETGKVVNEDGSVSNASSEMIDLGMRIIRELEMRRAQAAELANAEQETIKQTALDSKRQADVREQRAKLLADVESRFNVAGAFSQVKLS